MECQFIHGLLQLSRFLRIQYGDDYMTPVQAPTNHGGLILDPATDYRELLPKVRRDYRKSQLKRLLGLH